MWRQDEALKWIDDLILPTTEEGMMALRGFIRARFSTVYRDALIDGVTRYAWWQDGEQQVGTCGSTLKQAVEKIKQECQ